AEWVFGLVVIPVVSLPGMIGNISSLIVLYRHGFKKTSNILLAALSLADSFYLVGVNNIPGLIHAYSAGRGFHFSQEVSYLLYGLYQFYRLLELWGNWCSLTLPVLITLERLVAVYFPFQFPSLVTSTRTWVAVFVFCVIWLPVNVYYFFLEDLVFVQQGNEIVGRIVSMRSCANEDIYASVKKAAIILSEPIPIFLVVMGCITVGVRVRMANRKRKKMISVVVAVQKAAPAYRTTWTLMLVCIAYTVTIGTAFVLEMVVSVDWNAEVGVVLQLLVRLVKCVHSSCNFLIYIYINRNFRETYRSIF
ncbi:unnamed protein product, partial [Lymnaea stagnalis]